MNYYEYYVVIAYRDLESFQVSYTGFLIEDTDDQSQVCAFLSHIHSNCKYEIIAIDIEKTPINFSIFTDPNVINTVH
mgnify:CR=1 FL=1